MTVVSVPSGEDIAARGRAIFDRLRDPTPDSIDAREQSSADDEPGVDGAPTEQSDAEVEPLPASAPDAAQPSMTGTAVGDSQSPGEQAPPPAAPSTTGTVVTEDAEPAVVTPPPAVPAEPPVPPSSVEQIEAPAPIHSPGHLERPLPRVIAVANQKGGVGKTTTAVNLGASLAELGYRVLVIDLDPQGNATTGLGINPRNLESSVYDVILHDTPIEDAIEPTSLRNLFVVPATIDLAGAEIELVPAFSRELRLRRALEAVASDFDYCLIDCPPSLGLLTVNGLAAATEVLVPIQCEYYALEGLGQLLRNVNLVQGNLNPRLEVSAIVLTMYDARTKLADQVASEVRSHFPGKVARNIVPRTVRLSEAPSFGQPVIVFDPSSRGAIAYRELAKEVSGGAPQRTG